MNPNLNIGWVYETLSKSQDPVVREAAEALAKRWLLLDRVVTSLETGSRKNFPYHLSVLISHLQWLNCEIGHLVAVIHLPEVQNAVIEALEFPRRKEIELPRLEDKKTPGGPWGF